MRINTIGGDYGWPTVTHGINYDGDELPLWQGKILVSSLGRRSLRLLTIDGDRVQHEETILETEGRIYEPVVGPDGAVYVVMNDPGKILRLTAKQERKI